MLHVHPLKGVLFGTVLVAPNVVKSIINLVLPLVIIIITIVTMLHYCVFCFVFDILLHGKVQCMLIIPGKIP